MWNRFEIEFLCRRYYVLELWDTKPGVGIEVGVVVAAMQDWILMFDPMQWLCTRV